ncbi:MAG: hypothetical protein KF696_04535 [Planctomycetes bacterium]|nr:hypothetical protein [Planctomycetota bacterium]MCW8134240.1 hypothetical protein [Planctomycetota bacterium]
MRLDLDNCEIDDVRGVLTLPDGEEVTAPAALWLHYELCPEYRRTRRRRPKVLFFILRRAGHREVGCADRT